MAALAACTQSPRDVAKKAAPILKSLIGKQLAVPAQFAVGDLILVDVGKNTYQGAATVTYYGSSMTVPVKVLAQGDATIVNFSSPDLIKSIYAAKTSWLLGKTVYQVVDDPRFKTAFDDATLKHWAEVKANADVSSTITYSDGYYYGTSCKAHFCAGDNSLAFVVSKDTGEGELIYTNSTWNGSKETINASFYLRSDMGGADSLPAPLLAWLSDERTNGYELDPQTGN